MTGRHRELLPLLPPWLPLAMAAIVIVTTWWVIVEQTRWTSDLPPPAMAFPPAVAPTSPRHTPVPSSVADPPSGRLRATPSPTPSPMPAVATALQPAPDMATPVTTPEPPVAVEQVPVSSETPTEPGRPPHGPPTAPPGQCKRVKGSTTP